MLRALVTKEVLNNLHNARFALAYAVCVVLMVGSTANMLTEYLAQKKVHAFEQAAFDLAADGHTGDGWDLANRTVSRPPVLMQIFCLGGERSPDNRATINPYSTPCFVGEVKRDVLSLLFPTVDMLFVVGTLLSLLVFLLVSDSVSGEHQGGTLKLLLSCPVPRDLVISAKWLGGFVCLAMPYLASWLIVVLLLLFTRSVSIGVDDWLRIAALIAIGLVHVATVFSLAMMVSVLLRRPEVAALALIVVWVLLIVALPSLSTPLAWLLRPGKGVQQTQLAMQRNATVGRFQERNPFYAELGRRFGDKDPDELSERERADMHVLGVEGRKHTFAFAYGLSFATLRADLAQLRAVDDLSAWLMRLSPAGCLQRAFLSVAGTGVEREQGLRDAMEGFTPKAYLASEEFSATRRIPMVSFIVHRAAWPEAIAGALLDAGLMAIMGMLFFLVAYGAFVRGELL